MAALINILAAKYIRARVYTRSQFARACLLASHLHEIKLVRLTNQMGGITIKHLQVALDLLLIIGELCWGTCLAMASFSGAQVELHVSYPEPVNYSVVMLACTDEFGVRQDDVEFLKNGHVLNSGSSKDQVTVTNTSYGEITFTFSQAQEGLFSCRSGSRMSSEIGLAGTYIITHSYKIIFIIICAFLSRNHIFSYTCHES